MGTAVPGIRSQSGDCTDGFGKMQFAEGNVYEGNWQDDEMEGIGTYTFASDGASWEGPWRDGQRGGVGTWRYPDGLAIGHSEGPDENDLWGTVAPAKWRAAAEAAAAAAAAVAASREGEGGAKEEENPINCLAAMGVGKDDAERAALLAKHGGNVEVAVAAFFG